MIRLGLCCIFLEEDIKFHYTTVKIIRSLKTRELQLQKLSGIALGNAQALLESVKTCKKMHIGAFRVLSQIMPIYSHPEFGYDLDDLPDAKEIRAIFETVKSFAENNNIRLSFHPDQFNIIASPRNEVLKNTIRELSYQCFIADLIGADNVNIHMGGTYGDKQATLKRFIENYKTVPDLIKRHLTLENDDISYSPEDLYPVCMAANVPMIYDVHHHRCHQDKLSVMEACEKSLETWEQAGREPHFHISSPRDGWESGNPRIHSDYINIRDFPKEWLGDFPDFTLDIEARNKELAVNKVYKELDEKGIKLWK